MNTEMVYCYFYIINYTLGSGFLTLPYIFYKAGILIATLTYMFYCVITLVSALYVVEFLGRVHLIDKGIDSEEESQLISDKSGKNDRLFLHSQDRKYEISESGQVLFSYWVNVIITFLFFCFTMTSQWAYCAIAASSIATNLPLNTPTFLTCNASEFITRLPTQPRCLNLYRVSIVGYGIVVILLSVIGLRKQKYLQLILGLARFILLFSIILFSIVKIILDIVSQGTTSIPTNNNAMNATSIVTYTDILLKVNILYIFYGIPVFLYTLQNHCFLPTALFTVTNKKVLKNLILVVFLTLGISLSILGMSISLAFAQNNNPNCVLNWLPYTHPNYHILLRIFAYAVIFFPVIDILSCFPLSTILLANIVFQIIMKLDTSQIHNLRQELILLVIRCLLAVLPILLSLFVANLIIITDISGLFSIALTLITPVIFQWRSQRLVQLIPGFSETVSQANSLYARTRLFLFSARGRTPYSGWYSGVCAQIALGSISVITLLVCVASVIYQTVKNPNGS